MSIIDDVGFSLRFLARRPGFTLAAALALGIGIGVTIAVFGVFHTMLVRPLPLREPDRIVVVSESHAARGLSGFGCSHRAYTALSGRRDVFSETTALYSRIANLEAGEERLTVTSWQTNAGFFETLGLRLPLGRGFLPDETRVGSPAPVVVLGHRLWRQKFGSDAQVIGRVVRVDDVPVTVVGVMPPTEQWLEADLLVPLQPIVTDFQSRRMLEMIGRLRPGVTTETVAKALQETAARLAREWPETHAGWALRATPFIDTVIGADARRILLLLGGAVFLVLLIASANLASLLLARAVGRRRELAIQAALGAGRGDVARRLITESLMLALLGAGLGLVLALWCLDLFRAFGAGQLPRIDVAALGWSAMVFAALTALGVGLLTGLVPALQSAGANLNEALKEGSGGAQGAPERQRLRRLLVVVEVALSFALLTGAGLLGRSVIGALQVHPGLEVADRFAITVNLPPVRYPTGASIIDFWMNLFERLEAVPGLQSAAATSDRWLLAGRRVLEFDVEGGPEETLRVPLAELRTVTPGYFRTLGIPVIEGRVFDDGDRGPADAPPEEQGRFVVVVSKTLAARQWPGERAVGRRIRPIVGNAMSYWSTVVGIVDDIRQSALTESPVPTVYLPEYQYAWRRLFLLVHAPFDPDATMPAVRAAINSVDSTLPVDDVVPLEDLKYQSLSLARSVTFVITAFAVIAVLMAGFGVYSLISYSVACRTQEFGVRVALGASQRNILGLVLRQGVRLVLLGEAMGAGLALLFGTLVRSMLFEVSPADPAVFGTVACFLLLVALAALIGPAWSAARVEPARALRAE
jgi:putative ABC transport system permease protein